MPRVNGLFLQRVDANNQNLWKGDPWTYTTFWVAILDFRGLCFIDKVIQKSLKRLPCNSFMNIHAHSPYPLLIKPACSCLRISLNGEYNRWDLIQHIPLKSPLLHKESSRSLWIPMAIDNIYIYINDCLTISAFTPQWLFFTNKATSCASKRAAWLVKGTTKSSKRSSLWICASLRQQRVHPLLL